MRIFRSHKKVTLFSRALPFLDRWLTPAQTRFHRWAEPRLARIERQMSRRLQIILISIFCLIAGGYSTVILVIAISSPTTSAPSYLMPSSISSPVPIHAGDSVRIPMQQLALPDSLTHSSSINK